MFAIKLSKSCRFSGVMGPIRLFHLNNKHLRLQQALQEFSETFGVLDKRESIQALKRVEGEIG